jgi:Cu2+-exporting ATPase
VEDVDAEAVVVGDELLVRPGELVPCDGVVLTGRSHVDAARLTGEPVPVSATAGVALLSGSLNLEGPLTLSTTAPASESQYAKIVELVRTAQESKSPLQRLATAAVWFSLHLARLRRRLPLTAIPSGAGGADRRARVRSSQRRRRWSAASAAPRG